MFFIIFGTKGRIRTDRDPDILERACPSCKSDLVRKKLEKWFTLFFIPVFPIQTVDTFYQCVSCNTSYKESARKALLDHAKAASIPPEEKERLVIEGKRMFTKTLIACMALMAKIDGKVDESELQEIDSVIKAFPDFKKELVKIKEKVITEDSEEFVNSLLRESHKKLTSEAVISIIGKAGKVLMADGKIDIKEERLMKDFLKTCNLPASFYNIVLEDLKQKRIV